jgi:hypothetical protein
MLYYDYVDIGTCDFDIADNTLCSTKKYLLVEPLSFYLDKTPTGPNIEKLNAAVSNVAGEFDCYYVDPQIIARYNLDNWVKGCSSINKKHPTITLLEEQHGVNLTSVQRVPVVTFYDILVKYKINFIENLKIDTEGHDHIILTDVASAILRGDLIVNNIKFEYLQAFKNLETLDAIIKILSHKYICIRQIDNVMLIRKTKHS